MKTLEELIKQVPQGWTWLIRNDEKRGYLANLSSPETEDPFFYGVDGKHYFPVYASTPNEALELSIIQTTEFLETK